VRFVTDWERDLYSMVELCERYGVSRKTGYKRLGRYEADGPDGLRERSRAPHHCPHRIDSEVAALICAARRQHPSLQSLHTALMTQYVNWVLDADIRSFFKPAYGGGGMIMLNPGCIGPRAALAAVLAFSVPLAAPLAAEAQQATKVARIGYLLSNPAANPHLHEAFRQGLRDLGYVEGRNLVIEYRSAEGKLERLPALAAELVALKVDVIVAGGTPAALATKQATKTLPIVFTAVADPVTSGLVTSLARPGGNVTGLSVLLPELVGKCLERLKQAVPEVSRVAVLWQPGGLGERTEKDMLKRAEVAARALGVRLQFLEARGPADFDRAFSDMTRARAGALTVLASNMLLGERRRLVDLAAENRLPAVYTWRDFVDAGGLMAYGPDLADSFRRAATYVDKILKGAKPGDLPVEQPTKFELVINLKTAKALGLTIPPSLLGQADQVIQ
jgi:putative tryptophan/tyrosine transport system substrate-binding protein